MAHVPFDPAGAVTFDLSSGHVNLKQAPARILVPARGLAAMCKTAGEDATRQLGRTMGGDMGRRVASRLSGEVERDAMAAVPVDSFIEHLRGEFALVGVGVVSIERWGQALLFAVDDWDLPANLTSAVLEGALEASTGRSTTCLLLMEAGARRRFLVTTETTARDVSVWLEQGASWGDVLVKLHASTDPDGSRGEA